MGSRSSRAGSRALRCERGRSSSTLPRAAAARTRGCSMLSRVAESLYWTARYLERAEDVTRLLDVNYHALLDAQVADHGEAWQRIVALLGEEDAYSEHCETFTAQTVADWLL